MQYRNIISQHLRRFYHSLRRTVLFAAHAAASFLTLRKPVIRERYLKTRDGRLRGRYIAGSIATFALSTALIAALNVDPARQAVMPAHSDRADLAAMMAGQNAPEFDGATLAATDEDGTILPEIDPHAVETAQTDEQLAAIAPAAVEDMPAQTPPPVITRPNQWTEEFKLEKGGTLGGLLDKAAVPGSEAHAAIQAMGKAFSPSDMKPGQDIKVHFKRADDGSPLFAGMDVIKSGIETIIVRRADEGFEAKTDTKELITETRAARTRISSSLFADLAKAGVPDGIIYQLIKSYSWSIDFQRDIWGGEEVEVLYTVKTTEDEAYLRSDQLLYANLKMRSQENPIFHFTKKDGIDDFFGPNGSSVRKALLQTPIDGARISSGFGMRRHPVLGYSKMHKGLDFAAPTGTPIYAAGNGVVEKAQIFSSYGNYVQIRHNDTYKTAYAHMSRFGKGITKGTRVKQGQVIGYVGTTGRSTGPHLHYEVLVGGKQVNPRSVKLPIGDKLAGNDLSNFKAHMDKVKAQFKSTVEKTGPMPLAQTQTN